MKDTSNPEEQPKGKVAKQVVAAKRKYFVPKYGRNVEADSPGEAAEIAAKQADAEKQKDGDE